MRPPSSPRRPAGDYSTPSEPEPSPSQGWGWWPLGVFVGWTLFASLNQGLKPSQPGGATGLEVGLICCGALAVFLSLNRWVPWQNLAGAAAGLWIGLEAALTASAHVGLPLGPIRFTELAGPSPLGTAPLGPACFWVIVVLASRGVGRLLLRPMSQHRDYGLWLIATNSLLVVAMDVAVEPYAVQIADFWLWRTAGHVSTWLGAPWVSYLAWWTTAILLNILATPWFLKRKPAPIPDDYTALAVWMGLLGYLTLGSAVHGLTRAAWAGGGVAVAVAGGVLCSFLMASRPDSVINGRHASN